MSKIVSKAEPAAKSTDTLASKSSLNALNTFNSAKAGGGLNFPGQEEPILLQPSVPTHNTIHGDAAHNNLIGTTNADIIYGYEGEDGLNGGAGNDTLYGGAGGDILIGGAGADVLDGGEDQLGTGAEHMETYIDFIVWADAYLTAQGDTANYADSNAKVTIDLSTGTATGGHAQGDVLVDIEHLVGSRYNDTLIGNDEDNILEGGKGSDYMDGGLGIDTVSYQSSSQGVFVNLYNGNGYGTSGDAAGDSLRNIENLIGSNYNDALIGDRYNNYLEGAGGNDVLQGGMGADILEGGGGIDTATYALSGAAVHVDLALHGYGTAGAIGGEAQGDILNDIENLVGSAFNDKLTGDAGNNRISGGAGADTLTGGAGVDTAGYENSAAAVTVNLGTNVNTGGDAQGDKLYTIENVEGSNYNDKLTGNSSNNVLTGGFGNDSLYGGAGNDTLYGGYASETGLLESSDAQNVLDGGTGNDHLHANMGTNLLTGGAGADVFYFDPHAADATMTQLNNTVLDFQIGVDKIGLVNVDKATIHSWVEHTSEGTLLQYGEDISMLLKGVQLTSTQLDNAMVIV